MQKYDSKNAQPISTKFQGSVNLYERHVWDTVSKHLINFCFCASSKMNVNSTLKLNQKSRCFAGINDYIMTAIMINNRLIDNWFDKEKLSHLKGVVQFNDHIPLFSSRNENAHHAQDMLCMKVTFRKHLKCWKKLSNLTWKKSRIVCYVTVVDLLHKFKTNKLRQEWQVIVKGLLIINSIKYLVAQVERFITSCTKYPPI